MMTVQSDVSYVVNPALLLEQLNGDLDLETISNFGASNLCLGEQFCYCTIYFSL